MARALLTATVMDQAGNVVQNALVNVYLTGTTTPVSDMFAAASGGSPVTQLTSDGRGMIVGWFTADKVVDLVVTDNTHAAYRPDTPATLLTFVDYTKTVAVEPDQSMVVHTTGAETIAGVKTFTSSPVVPDGSFSAAKLSFDVATQAELDAESSTRASGDTAAIATAEAFAVQRSNHTGTQTASTVSDFNTAVRTNRLDQMAAPTAAVALNSQKITGLANPTAAQDAMTKASADAAYVSVNEGPLYWGDSRVGGVSDGGAADQTTAMTAALALLATAGGELLIPGKVRCDGQVLIPNDSASPPLNKGIKLKGLGSWRSGDSAAFDTPTGGTILDLRYNGAGVAKIDSRGHGILELEDITFVDGAATNIPFVQTTLTTPRIHGCSFIGSKTGTACDQDAIVCGGGGDSIDGTATAKFDGYGGIIDDNFFDGIRRPVLLNPAANGLQVVNNTIWLHCGAPSKLYGAIQLAGDSTKTVSGNYVAGNLIECTNYATPIHVGPYATLNHFVFNDFYDASGTTLVFYWIDANCNANFIMHGFSVDSGTYLAVPFYEHPSSAGGTTFISAHQGQKSRLYQPRMFGAAQVVANNGVGVASFADSGDQAYLKVSKGNTPRPTIDICDQPGVAFADVGTTSGSVYITSLTAAWVSTDLLAPVVGTGIPSSSFIHATYTTSTAPAWVAATAYAVGDIARPAAANGHMYQATVAGTSGSVQPTFPTDGSTVVDGGVTWKDLGAVSAAALSKNATVTGTGVTVNFGRPGQTEEVMVRFERSHIVAQGASSPSGAIDAGAGTAGAGATIAVAGKDLAYQVTLTTGSDATVGSAGSPTQLCHVNAGVNFTAAPKVSISTRNVGAAQMRAVGLYAVTSSTGQLQLFSIGTTPVSTVMIFDIVLVQ